MNLVKSDTRKREIGQRDFQFKLDSDTGKFIRGVSENSSPLIAGTSKDMNVINLFNKNPMVK